ncbi:MAG: hypothetical protein ACI865_000329 [Flavobacteriaceae bacterium]|jgi:hypothetical protein
MKLNKFFTFSLFALLIGVTFVSCRKKEDTIAVIKVLDANNQVVIGATVILYGQSTTNQPSSVDLYDTTQTNSAGEASFNFNEVYQLGQAGVAVLNIDVNSGSLSGQGIIKIEQETTTTETVFVQ